MKFYPMKFRIQNEGGTTRVDVYDDIGGGGPFSNGVSAADFAASIAGVRGQLEVHINSGGGVVWDGQAIAAAIRNHKGPKRTVADGLAASIASVIFQAGDERVIEPGAMLMIHDAYAPAEGNAEELRKLAGKLDQVSDELAAVYASRAGGTVAEWRARMRNETWYGAEEAVRVGLADRVGLAGAQIPAGYDLAAYHLPTQIAASLRTLPVKAAAEQSCAEMGHQCCRDMAATNNVLRSLIRDAMRNDTVSTHPPMSGTHTHGHYDGEDGDHTHEHTHDGDADHTGPVHAPSHDFDGDGDDDTSASGDTDHDYVPANYITRTIRNADKYNADDRKRMAANGQALPDGSYPIADEDDLHNAIHAVGRGSNNSHDTIRRHIIKRAKALGLSSAIPDNWDAGGGNDSSAGNRSAASFLALVGRE